MPNSKALPHRRIKPPLPSRKALIRQLLRMARVEGKLTPAIEARIRGMRGWMDMRRVG